jgi:F0F1-type ATP synthase assembly protein I
VAAENLFHSSSLLTFSDIRIDPPDERTLYFAAFETRGACLGETVTWHLVAGGRGALSAQACLRRVLISQAALATVVSLGLVVAGASDHAAASALYGGALGLLVSSWLAWRLERATAATLGDRSRATRLLYGALLQKYLIISAALVLGFKVFGLAAGPLLLGFAVTPIGYLAAARGGQR